MLSKPLRGESYSSNSKWIPVGNILERFSAVRFGTWERSAIGRDDILDADPPVLRDPPRIERGTLIAIGLGIASLALYALLFHYDQQLRMLATDTQHGHKALFTVPIVIAFTFSLVHGAFTDRFWGVLGLQAAKK